MNKTNNVSIISATDIIAKKSRKYRKIIVFSVFGLSALAVSVSLPFGFLTNFIKPPAIVEPPPPPPPIYPYDPSVSLSDSYVSFKAYYVPAWKKLTLTQILEEVSLSKDAEAPNKQITLENLANFGIVPSDETYKHWDWVKAAPKYGSSNSFKIYIRESITSPSPIGYDVSLLNNQTIKPSTYYDSNSRLGNFSDFFAYRPNGYTKLSDFYLTYLKNSSNPLTNITIANLEKIGIVPVFDEYKSWDSISLFPINGHTIKVSITNNTNPTKSSTYNINGFTSTFYNANSNPTFSSNDFFAYVPNSFSQTTLVDLNLEFNRNSQDQSKLINFANLEKIGIVPLNNNYKSWDSIRIYPIGVNEVKIVITPSSSGVAVEYTITGVKPSTLYDVNASPIYQDTNFIMYEPYAWRTKFPIEAAITLTQSSQVADTRISLRTLEKIGIVPKNLQYTTWTSIEITATASATCKIVIKSNNNSTKVAEFSTTCLKSSKLYDTANVIHTSTNPLFNFIWYKPVAWNVLYARDINLDFTNSSNITLANLENIGIVPLNNNYRSWSSIVKTDIMYGLQGKFHVTMTNTTQPSTPLGFEINNLKVSALYDPFTIIRQYPTSTNPDFIQFAPYSFTNATQTHIGNLKGINWTPRDITVDNLETVGIVPITNYYQGWSRFRFDRETTDTLTFKFFLYAFPGGTGTDLFYPFTRIAV